MNSFRRLTLVAVLIVTLLAGNLLVHAQTGQTPEEICAAATENLTEPETRTFDKADQVLKEGVDYSAVICTEAGPIYVDLFEQEAPITVNNFVFLAQQGYYNNTTFHRVLPGFMAQGGDPTGTGGGDPGYSFEDETSNGLIFDQIGLLAMANAGPNTNGSQFFITYGKPDWLNGQHTVFGRVVQGLDVAELLTPRDPQQNPTEEGAALDTVVIVEDPASVNATPDGPPSLEHFQTLLEQNIASRISGAFTLQDEYSHTYDAAAEAESWRDDGGDDLVNYMTAYLSDHGFQGTAAILLTINECPEDPESLPVWLVGFQISDYGSADSAQQVVFDDARSDELVSTGAYESFTDLADGTGRVYRMPLAEPHTCGDNGVYYRLEMPYGRYILSTDLIVNADFINESSDMPADQYLTLITQDLVLGGLGSVLDRGTAAE